MATACPHKKYCTCPGPGCTVEYYRACPSVSIDCIVSVLVCVDYRTISVPEKISFIHTRFGIHVAADEISYPLPTLAMIIRARLDIAYEQVA